VKKRPIRILTAVIGTAVLSLGLSACIQANQGANWLTSHLAATDWLNGAPASYVPYGGSPDIGDTAQTALTLVATGQTSALPAVLNYLEYHAADYTNVPASGGTPGYTDAGHVALLLLVAHATGTQSAFSATSLLATLRNTQQLTDTGYGVGLFGSDDPTYDGVYRTALALEALVASGVPLSDSAIVTGRSWLLAQQCPSGGFTAAAATNPCNGDPANWQGPDTNSTAQALIALHALNESTAAGTPSARAVAWLGSLESSTATWPFFPGSVPDSNSSAIVCMGLRAAGEALSATRYVRSGGTWPLLALLNYEDQTPGADFGGYVFQPGDLPDPISTEQVALTLSGVTLPL